MPRWRKEEGGAELDDVSVKILETELGNRDTPIGVLATTNLVWPAVEASGDPGLRDELKPGVAKGTVRIALGYTEPDGGPTSRPRRRGRCGRRRVGINGSKIFTSNAQNARTSSSSRGPTRAAQAQRPDDVPGPDCSPRRREPADADDRR